MSAHPPRARRHRPRPRAQVRGLLPRPRRRAAGRRGQRRRDARHPRLAGGPARRTPSSRCRRPTTISPPRAAAFDALGQRARLRHRRAGRRQHGPGAAAPGVPRGPARALRSPRRAADLRRGDHRLPRRLGRRAGALRRRRPDLTCLGKIVGGGLPAAAYGGRRELMTQLAPEGPVYQAGTLSGNPLAMAAGLATLRRLARPGSYEKLEARSATDWPRGCASAPRRPASSSPRAVGGIFGFFFHPGPVENFADAQPRRRGALPALLRRHARRTASTSRRPPSSAASSRSPTAGATSRRRSRRPRRALRRVARAR